MPNHNPNNEDRKHFPSTDHLGQHFPSQKAMCEAWGIKYGTYATRLRSGWSVEEALTGDRAHTGHGKPCTDHTGREFESTTAMCKHWGIGAATYRQRILYGWSQEEALTSKVAPTSKPCTDHTGRTFSSVKDMCEAWGIATSVYSTRSKKGWSTEETLTGKRPCTDHTGREFPSQKAMCEAWGIARPTYLQRLKRGWSLEEALTGNRTRKGHSQPCYDHEGREFPSQVAMLEHWGITRAAYNSRLKRGWSLEEALTGNRKPPKDKESSK